MTVPLLDAQLTGLLKLQVWTTSWSIFSTVSSDPGHSSIGPLAQVYVVNLSSRPSQVRVQMVSMQSMVIVGFETGPAQGKRYNHTHTRIRDEIITEMCFSSKVDQFMQFGHK